MLTTATGCAPFSGFDWFCCRRDRVEPARSGRHHHPVDPPGRGRKSRGILATKRLRLFRLSADKEMAMVGTGATSEALAHLAEQIRIDAWELALAVVEEGQRDDQIPPLARLGGIGQLGDMPTFISELAQQLA